MEHPIPPHGGIFTNITCRSRKVQMENMAQPFPHGNVYLSLTIVVIKSTEIFSFHRVQSGQKDLKVTWGE